MIPVFRTILRLFTGVRRRKLVLYKPDRIGDFVLALGAARALLEDAGPENCLLVLSPQGKTLAQKWLPRVEIVCLQSGCEIRSVFQLPAILREICALSAIQAGKLVSLKHHKREIDFLYESIIEAETTHSMIGDLSVSRLRSLALNTADYPPAANPPLSREMRAHQVIVGQALKRDISYDRLEPGLDRTEAVKGQVIVSPFGTNPVRDLRPGQIRKALPRETRSLVFIGTGDQGGRLRALAEEFSPEQYSAVEVKDELSLDEYLQLVASAEFVISTETATAHLAVAFGKPGIGFLGGGHFGFFAPWGEGPFQWKFKKMDCYQCNWNCIYDKTRCLREL